MIVDGSGGAEVRHWSSSRSSSGGAGRVMESCEFARSVVVVSMSHHRIQVAGRHQRYKPPAMEVGTVVIIFLLTETVAVVEVGY